MNDPIQFVFLFMLPDYPPCPVFDVDFRAVLPVLLASALRVESVLSARP